MSFISKTEAAQLNRMRDLLEVIEERAKQLAYGKTADESAVNSFYLGRVAERAEEAGDAVFDVLNALSAYLSCPNARAAIDDRQAARDKRRAELYPELESV